MVFLGAHVSISGGIFNAPINGKNLNCTAIQIFTKNERQWNAPELEQEAVEKYKQNLEKTEISSVMSHDTYLINLGSPEKEKRERSIQAFITEIKRADKLNCNGLVFHPGSHMKQGEKQGIKNICQSLNKIIDETKYSTLPLLIEITSGQGTNVGYRFEHLRDIIDNVKDKKRMGVCIDTCHMFCAGYDIRTKKAYENTFSSFDKIIGLENIKCIHMNDSKQPYNSKKDRHENIGEGKIGKNAFGFFMNDKQFEHVPKILETPGGENSYKKDLKLLKSLIK